MVLAAKCDKRLSKSDEADAEGSVVDYRLDCVVFSEFLAVKPECAHQERELLLESRLLEVESLVELLCRNVKSPSELVEELVDSVLLVLDAHALDSELHDVDCCEGKVSTADGCLRSEPVLEYTCTAAHCCNLVLVSLRVISSP